MKTAFLHITLALALLAPPASNAARGGRPHGPHHAGRPEIRAYMEKNVLPVLRQQRQQLELQLSATDRAQLATYRTQLQALRQRGRTLHQSLRPGKTTPSTERPALTDAQKEQLQQLRTETRGIMQNVNQLAQKYEADIAKLTQEIQPQQEQWTADIRALATKSLTPEQQQKMTQLGGRMRPHGGADRYLHPAAFMLLSPESPALTERELGRTSVFPNPTAATSQLDYEVTKTGPVTVELLDGRGNTLRTVMRETKQEKGPHNAQIDVHDLPNGTYYYKITTKSGSETRRFVKE